MDRWPGWSAPLLGSAGVAFAGVFIAAGTRGFISSAQGIVGGAIVGAFGGLIVWSFDWLGKSRDEAKSPSPLPPSLEIPEDAIGLDSPRKLPLRLLLLGAVLLVLNHVLALTTGTIFFSAVVGGAFFVCLGSGGLFAPAILAPLGKATRLTWWDHIVAVVTIVAVLAFSVALWFIYRR